MGCNPSQFQFHHHDLDLRGPTIPWCPVVPRGAHREKMVPRVVPRGGAPWEFNRCFNKKKNCGRQGVSSKMSSKVISKMSSTISSKLTSTGHHLGAPQGTVFDELASSALRDLLHEAFAPNKNKKLWAPSPREASEAMGMQRYSDLLCPVDYDFLREFKKKMEKQYPKSSILHVSGPRGKPGTIIILH